MSWLGLSPTGEALLALAVVAAMFALFLREAYPAEVVAIAGAAALLATGLLPHDAALDVLANPAPWTIAALFIVMGALVRTGALEGFTRRVAAQAAARPVAAMAALTGFVVLSSAVISNTPVVVVMIPVFVQLARQMGVAASKLLIPLSYAAVLGGTLTLLGTSTNLLVDGVARAEGLAPFTIFEVTPLAAILVAWGMLYLWLVAPRILPERASMATLLAGDRSRRRFFTEAVIPDESSLVGREVLGVDLFSRDGVRLVDVIRGDRSLRRELDGVTLQVGDRVVLRSGVSELLGLQATRSLRRIDKVSTIETETVEVLVPPGSGIVGGRLGDLRLRRRFGIYPLAVHRRNRNIGRQIDDLVVQVGDTLLLEGAAEDIARFAREMRIGDVSKPTERAFRRERAPVAILAVAGIVGLAALGVAPIHFLAVLAVALVLVARCIDADEAFGFIDGRLLALVFSMLAVGAALEATGAVALIASALASGLADVPPWLVVWAIYLMTSVLTELVSNNAVAVVVTPIAIGLAQALGIDPRPLVIAVMIAASASFATPIGYQTNMMVYGPGGYRFTDFVKVGVPLNLSVGLLASALIPLIWPL